MQTLLDSPREIPTLHDIVGPAPHSNFNMRIKSVAHRFLAVYVTIANERSLPAAKRIELLHARKRNSLPH